MKTEELSGQSSETISTYDMLIRWEIAADHLSRVEADGKLGDCAMRTLIYHDFPLLLNLMKKFRPGIWGTEISARG